MAAKRDPVYINTPFGVPLGTSLVQQPFGDGYRTVQGNIAAQTAAGGAAATHPSVFAQAQALGQQTFESAGLPFQPALSVQPFNNMSAMFYASGVRGAQLLYYPTHAASFAYLRDVSAQNLKGANVSINPPAPIITALGLEGINFRHVANAEGTIIDKNATSRQQLYMSSLLGPRRLLGNLMGEQSARFAEKYPHKTEKVHTLSKLDDINAYDALYYTQQAFGAKEPHAYMPFIAYQQYTQAYPNVDLELFGNTMATYARQLMRLSEENNLKYFVPEPRLQAETYSNIDYVDLLKEHGVLEQELRRQDIPLSITGPFAFQSFGPVTAYDLPVRVYDRAEGILEDVEPHAKFDYFHGDSKTVRRALAVPTNKDLGTYADVDPKYKKNLIEKHEEAQQKQRVYRAEQRAQDTAPQGDLSGLRALSLVGSHRANAQSQVAVPVPVINPAPSQVAAPIPRAVSLTSAGSDAVYINTPFGVPLGTSLVQQPFSGGYRAVQANIAAQTAAGGAAATHPSVYVQAQALGAEIFGDAGLPFYPTLSMQPFNNMSAMFYASGVPAAQLLYYIPHAGVFRQFRPLSKQNIRGENISLNPLDPIISALGLDEWVEYDRKYNNPFTRHDLYKQATINLYDLHPRAYNAHLYDAWRARNPKWVHGQGNKLGGGLQDLNAYDALYYTQRAFGANEPHAYMPFIAYQQYTQAYPNVDLELFGNTMATYARQLMRLSEENNLKYFVPEQRLQAGTYSNIDYVDLLKENDALAGELRRQGIPLSDVGPFQQHPPFGPVTAYDLPVRVYDRAEGILEDVEPHAKFDYFHGDAEAVLQQLDIASSDEVNKVMTPLVQYMNAFDSAHRTLNIHTSDQREGLAYRAQQRAASTAPQGANAPSQVAVPAPVINPAPSQVAVPAPVVNPAPSQVAAPPAPPAPPSGGGGGGGGSSSSSGGGGGEPPRKRPRRVAREAQSAVAAVAAVTPTAEEISTPATRAAAAAASRGEAPPAVLPAADFITEPRARVVFESEDSVAIRNHELEQARLADAQRQREHELEVRRMQAQSVQLTVAGQTEVAQLQLTQQTKAGEAAAAAQEAQRILAAEAASHQQAQIAKQAEADISVAQAVEAAKTQSYQQRYDFTASRREEAAAKREAKSDARRQRQKKERLIESINDRFIALRGEAFAPAAELMLEPMDELQGIAQNIKIEEREQRVAQQQARVEERQARAEERAEAARVKAEEKAEKERERAQAKAEKERERAQAKAEKDRVKREREFDREEAQQERQQEREAAKILSLGRQLQLRGVSDGVIAEAMLEGGSTGLQALMHQVKLDAQDAKEQAQLEKGMFLAPRFREAALAGGFYTQDATGRFRFVQTGRGSFIGGFSGGLFGGQARETDPLATKEGYLAGQRAVIAAQALNIGGGALVGGAIGYASAGVTGAVVGGLMGGKAGLLGLAQQGIAMARGAGASDFFGAIGAFNADVSKYMQLHYDVATQAANVELPANHFRYAIARSRSTGLYYSQTPVAPATDLISARVGIAPEKAIQVLSGVAQALPFGFDDESYLAAPTKSGALAELMLRGYDPVRMAQTQSAYGLYAGGVTSGQRNIQRVLTAYETTLSGESQRSINQIQMLMDQTYQGAQARELKGLSSMSPVRYAQHVRAGGAGREALTMSVMSKSEDLGISVASAGLAPLEGSAQQLMFAYAMQRTGGDVSRAAEYARNMRGGEQLGAFTAMGVSANVRGMMLQAAGLSLKEQGALGRAFSKKHLDAAGQPEAEVLSAPADDKSMAVATATSAASRTAVASTYGSDPDKMIDRLNAIVSAMNTFTRQVTTNGLSAKDVRELNSALSSLGGQIREMNKNFVKFVVPKISAVGSAVLPAAQTE